VLIVLVLFEVGAWSLVQAWLVFRLFVSRVNLVVVWGLFVWASLCWALGQVLVNWVVVWGLGFGPAWCGLSLGGQGETLAWKGKWAKNGPENAPRNCLGK
jgi:hypothetical protein